MTKKDLLLPEFIQLRIEGLSFQAIADKLGVAKQTLLEWNKDLSVKTQIGQGVSFRLNNLVRSYEMDSLKRLEGLLQYRQRLNEELSNRKLDDVPADKLLKMLLDLTAVIKTDFSAYIRYGEDLNIES